MSDTQNIATIAQVIADYLVDRDDIASAVVGEYGPGIVAITTQTGESYMVQVVNA